MDDRLRLLERAAATGDAGAAARLRREKERAGQHVVKIVVADEEGRRMPLPEGIDPEKAIVVSAAFNTPT